MAGALLAALPLAASASHVCSVSVGNISFGAFTGTQKTATATMTVSCTLSGGANETANFTATLSTGTGTYAQRLDQRTAAPFDTLNYNLYKTSVPTPLNTQVWGDGSGTTVTWVGSVAMTTVNRTNTATLTVAAALAASAALPTAGTYSDTITATIIYN